MAWQVRVWVGHSTDGVAGKGVGGAQMAWRVRVWVGHSTDGMAGKGVGGAQHRWCGG